MWLVLCDNFSLSLYVMLCWAESWKSNSRAHCLVCWGTSYSGLKDWECSMSKLFTMGKTSIHLQWLSQTVFCNTNTYNFYNYNFEITFIFSYFQWYCRPSLNVSDRDSCSQTVRPTESSSNTWLSSAHSGAWSRKHPGQRSLNNLHFINQCKHLHS